MAKRRSLLSPQSKAIIARELGVAELVARDGWGAVPTRQCGAMVRVAVEHAERLMAQRAREAARVPTR